MSPFHDRDAPAGEFLERLGHRGLLLRIAHVEDAALDNEHRLTLALAGEPTVVLLGTASAAASTSIRCAMRGAAAAGLLDELRSLARSGGYADPAVLRHVDAILFALAQASSPRTIGVEAARIAGAFENLYSARTHQRYRPGELQQVILRGCQGIATILASLARAGGP